MRKGIFCSERERSGSTLMELVVTLAIIGLLMTSGITFGMRVYDRIENRRFNDECEALLDEILAIRNDAVMSNSLPAGCKFYRQSVVYYHYDAENRRHTQTRTFETFRIKEVSGVLEIYFEATGTVSKSTTLTLVSEKGGSRRLIFQPVTGRIYLADEE